MQQRPSIPKPESPQKEARERGLFRLQMLEVCQLHALEFTFQIRK
jgi:hypothetical protein